MKLKTDKKEFSLIGEGVEEKEFSIDTNNDIIIKVLRDKMYQNKIGAVCREVISNSRDANRENGKSDTPVKVELTCEKTHFSEEYYISFSDEGLGINPERMENIFLKYGGSTKRETDEYTGGFGIGAKTPFAYTDEFFINTVVSAGGENFLFQYQALITSDGTKESSKMILINKEKTTQQTGTKITIPIQEEDIEEFKEELIYTTSFWKVKPHFVGFDFSKDTKKLTIVYEQEEFMFITEKKYNNIFGEESYIILIDEIPYVFDNKKLLEINKKTTRQFLVNDTNCKFVLKFRTGEITVSASREDVEYTKENIKKIIERNDLMISESEKIIKEKITQANSYSESCKNASQIFNYNLSFRGKIINHFITEGIFVFLALVYNKRLNLNPKDYKYNNQEIKYKLSFSQYVFIKVINKGGKMMKDSILNSSFSHKDWDLPMYFLDVKKQNKSQTEYLKENHPNGYVLVFEKSNINYNTISNFNKKHINTISSFNEKYFKTKEEEKEIMDMLNLKLNPYSKIPKLKTDKNVVKKEKVDYIKVPIKLFDEKNGRWESVKMDFYENENKTDFFENIKKVVYIEVDYLSNLKGGYVRGIIQDLSVENSLKISILNKLGYDIIAISAIREKYVKNLKINSLDNVFNHVVENNKNIKDAVQYILSLKLNLGSDVNCQFLNELNFDAKYKNAFKILEEDLELIFSKISKGHIIKDLVNVLEFAEEDFFKFFKLEKQKEIDLLNEFIENNPLIKTFLKIEDSDYYFTTNETKKYDGEILNDVRKQILTLFK